MAVIGRHHSSTPIAASSLQWAPPREACATDLERQRNSYLATVAHEMRNALAPLTSAIEILEARAAERGDTGALLPIARRQIRQLTALTDDLLNVGRAVNNEFHVALASENVQALVHDVVAACSVLAGAKQQVISVDTPATQLFVLADRMRLSQVLQNIIGNAINFTPERGRIDVRVRQRAGEVAIAISDTGIGIPSRDLRKVFDLFYRVRRHGTGGDGGGCGIGLALARQLIELHGGTISVRSDGPGTGATFAVTLPLGVPPAVA